MVTLKVRIVGEIKSMRTSDLEEFVFLASTLSFTKTARKFHVTQPTLSKHIAALESELGFDLLVRGRRGVSLTLAGAAFAEKATSVLESLQEAILKATEANDQSEKAVSVAYLAAACRGFLPKFGRQFSQNHKDIRVSYRGLNMEGLNDALDNETADIYIAGDKPNVPNGYTSKMLLRSPFCLVVHKNHDLAKKEFVCLEDLKGQRIQHLDFAAVPFIEDIIEPFLSPIKPYITIKGDVFEMDDWQLALSGKKTAGLASTISGDYLGSDIVYVPFSPQTPNVPTISLCAIWREDSRRKGVLSFLEELFSYTKSLA